MECSDKLKQAGIDILISVIIPIYNVEQYLKQCLDSVINQTYRNLEIILVDDGSTDKSGLICDEYSQKDKRIKVIHKKNEGVAVARNTGLDNCSGEYITFVDSDDVIDIFFFERLYKLSKNYNADITIGKHIELKEQSQYSFSSDVDNGELIERKELYRKIFLQEGTDAFLWAKLYKKNIFDNIRCLDGEIYEDIRIIDKIIEKCNIIVYTNYTGYCYIQHKGSITHGKMSDKYMSCIKAAEDLLELAKNKYPEIEYAAIRKYIYANYHVLGLSVLSDKYDNISKQLKENILKYKKFIFRSNYISKAKKIQTIFLMGFFPVYKILYRLFIFITY